jgi:hypothetical protein
MTNEPKRTVYKIARIYRETLAGNLFEPGDYSPADIMEKFIKSGVLQPWEMSKCLVSTQTPQVSGWYHNGRKGHASVWTREVVVRVPLEAPEEEKPVTFSARILAIEEHLARMDRNIRRMCSLQGIQNE